MLINVLIAIRGLNFKAVKSVIILQGYHVETMPPHELLNLRGR